jgi:hypothetical protein
MGHSLGAPRWVTVGRGPDWSESSTGTGHANPSHTGVLAIPHSGGRDATTASPAHTPAVGPRASEAVDIGRTTTSSAPTVVASTHPIQPIRICGWSSSGRTLSSSRSAAPATTSASTWATGVRCVPSFDGVGCVVVANPSTGSAGFTVTPAATTTAVAATTRIAGRPFPVLDRVSANGIFRVENRESGAQAAQHFVLLSSIDLGCETKHPDSSVSHTRLTTRTRFFANRPPLPTSLPC